MRMHFLSAAMLAVSAVVATTQSGTAVAASPNEIKPLPIGLSVPDVRVSDSHGKDLSLKSLISGKPTVLIFFRGGWCPYCNWHLSDLGTIQGALAKEGFQLLAISPDRPDKQMQMAEKAKSTYRLLSDSKADAIKSFGIGFRMDDQTFTTYRDKYRIDMEEWSGMKHHILPVPAVFIVDVKGTIKYVYTNPDYRVRMKGSEILAAAKAAKS